MIYLDNAATSALKPPQVAKAVYEAMESTTGNALRGVNEASLSALRVVSETRELLCQLFHNPYLPGTVFTFNATDSLNIVINGLFSKGEHVITTVMEHNSVLRPLYRKELEGVGLSIVPCNEEGTIDLKVLKKSFCKETKAVICTHASNLTGNVNDLYAIGNMCREHGVLCIVDASQTAGILPINMQEMNIDILCFSGHKGLLGPQGTGGICMREGITIRPLRVGGSGILTYDKEHPKELPAALEAGTLNIHGIAGLRAGISYILDMGIEKIYQTESSYTQEFVEGIRGIKDVKIYSNTNAKVHTPVIAMNLGDYDSAMVSDELMQRFMIATRSGGHCAPLMHQSLGTVSQGAVRFSFSHLNTREEVRKAAEAVKILATE